MVEIGSVGNRGTGDVRWMMAEVCGERGNGFSDLRIRGTGTSIHYTRFYVAEKNVCK